MDDAQLGAMLRNVWEGQERYNSSLGELCPDRTNPARWTEILLLGMQAEITEVLREIGWKRHRGDTSRIPRKIPRDNLAYELADVMKYCLSLWQVWGYSPENMLSYLAQKEIIMKQRLKQEFFPLPPENAKILLVDLDGTIADLRYALWEFAVQGSYVEHDLPFTVTSLHPDIDLKMPYRNFQEMKAKFTESGGYGYLPVFEEAAAAVRAAIKNGVYVIACTARPVEKYPRLWFDTWDWLSRNLIPVEQLHMGGDIRIQLLTDLAEKQYDIVLFDDDPEITERSVNSGVKVVLSRFIYNARIWDRPGVYPFKPCGFPFNT